MLYIMNRLLEYRQNFGRQFLIGCKKALDIHMSYIL